MCVKLCEHRQPRKSSRWEYYEYLSKFHNGHDLNDFREPWLSSQTHWHLIFELHSCMMLNVFGMLKCCIPQSLGIFRDSHSPNGSRFGLFWSFLMASDMLYKMRVTTHDFNTWLEGHIGCWNPSYFFMGWNMLKPPDQWTFIDCLKLFRSSHFLSVAHCIAHSRHNGSGVCVPWWSRNVSAWGCLERINNTGTMWRRFVWSQTRHTISLTCRLNVHPA